MRIDFNGEDGNFGKNKAFIKKEGQGYEGMLKERKRALPEMQDSIQKIMNDFNGESICIIVMKEDENGKPTGNHILMTGVAKPEMQLALGRALNDGAKQAVDVLMETIKKNPESLAGMMDDLLDELKGMN